MISVRKIPDTVDTSRRLPTEYPGMGGPIVVTTAFVVPKLVIPYQ